MGATEGCSRKIVPEVRTRIFLAKKISEKIALTL